MSAIEITRGKVAIVDTADYQWLAAYTWAAHLTKRKTHDLWFARRTGENHRPIYMHREILGVSDPRVLVDHINGDGLDNRRSNLRACTHQENARNARAVRSSGTYKGVRFHRRLNSKPFSAQIHLGDGRNRHLGYFATAEEAARAYDKAAIVAFGAFARLNFPREAPAELDVDVHDAVEAAAATSRIVQP